MERTWHTYATRGHGSYGQGGAKECGRFLPKETERMLAELEEAHTAPSIERSNTLRVKQEL